MPCPREEFPHPTAPRPAQASLRWAIPWPLRHLGRVAATSTVAPAGQGLRITICFHRRGHWRRRQGDLLPVLSAQLMWRIHGRRGDRHFLHKYQRKALETEQSVLCEVPMHATLNVNTGWLDSAAVRSRRIDWRCRQRHLLWVKQLRFHGVNSADPLLSVVRVWCRPASKQ